MNLRVFAPLYFIVATVALICLLERSSLAQTLPSCSQSVSSNEVILFIDFNANTTEVLKSSEVICNHHYQFQTIPNIALSQKTNLYVANITRLDHQIDQMDKKNKLSPSDEIKLKSLNQKQTQAMARLDKLTSDLDFDSLIEKTLSKIQKDKKKIIGIILSGKTENEKNIYGHFSDMDITDLQDLFENYRSVFKNTEFLIEWGCYHASDEALSKWSTYFKNLKVLAGYRRTDKQKAIDTKIFSEFVEELLNFLSTQSISSSVSSDQNHAE